jgi:excisionase family DNA binding protein
MRTDAMANDKLQNTVSTEARGRVQILDPRWDGKYIFSVPEAGEIIGISRPSAYLAARSGSLPTVRIGRRLVVPRHALERLLSPAQPANSAA